MVSTKKSSAGISRVPFGPRATIVAPSARIAAGWSAAMSAWATAPQVVPRLRTWTSPVHDAASTNARGRFWADAVWAWRTRAPIDT